MESLPTISQPTPGEFITIFRRILSEGHDVLAVLISGGLSGTVDSALSAIQTIRQETPAARIEVVDSRSNSLQEGYAVLSAAEARTAARRSRRVGRRLWRPFAGHGSSSHLIPSTTCAAEGASRAHRRC